MQSENEMTLVAKTEPGGLAVRAIHCVSTRDMTGLRDLLADDVIVEWPFAGRDTVRHRGIDAALLAFSPLAMFETFVLKITDLHELPEEGRVIMEGQSQGTLAGGRPDYVNRYVFVLSVVEGRITRWREYFNPVEGAKVFGKPQAAAALQPSS
jgi:ketosteroid isomerase-like protein